GAKPIIYWGITALVDPGDEVIYPNPGFPIYESMINFCGGVPVPIPLREEIEFRLDPAELADLVTDKTKMIIINSPHNPTSGVLTWEDLEAIAEIARERDIMVMSDEPYELILYEGEHYSIGAAEGMKDLTILLDCFSKTFAMTGWRLGWCTGPAEIIEKMTTLQQYSFVCAPSMAQVGALVALEADMSAEAAAYKRKRDMVYEALEGAFGLVKPGGAFYAFVPAPGGHATAFVTRAIQNNVLIIPGNVFSARDTHFRISYATSDDQLARGLEILVKLAS
ncbi:MAG: aminotransferase class I/II-fold pyridoxal phosphate-dependent enzyme, partial [Thermoplasmata archaeon]|nr:aminotransferase class I/II-fold pyridoxal phosphate-dependent enzyme [Thermoplasmata archaeon]